MLDFMTGGDPGISKALGEAYRKDPTFGRQDGDPRMLEYMDYISKAAASKK